MSGVGVVPEPKVSVIIPCYNSESTVGETLGSLQQQTTGDWEAIVVDDGSTDASAAVIRRHVREDSRIRYVEQDNQGLAGARNTGLEHAQGEFVNFLDADDLLLPEMLAFTIDALRCQPKAGVAYCGTILADRDLKDMTSSHVPEVEERPFCGLAVRNAFSCHCLLLRRTLFERVGEFDRSLRHCHDWDMWLRIARLGTPFVRVPRALVVYRMSRSSMSRHASSFFESGKAVILRGHAADPRVLDPAPEYAEGCRTSPAEAVAEWAMHAACIAITQDDVNEACSLLEIAHRELADGLELKHFAYRYYSLLYGAALTTTQLGELWPQVGRALLETLLQLEARLKRKGLAMQALLQVMDYSGQQDEIARQQEQIARQQDEIARQQEHLNAILGSRTWRVASKCHRVADSLLGRTAVEETPEAGSGR